MILTCLLCVVLGILNGAVATNAIWENRLRCRALDRGRISTINGDYHVRPATPFRKQG